jgi:ribonuclease PH
MFLSSLTLTMITAAVSVLVHSDDDLYLCVTAAVSVLVHSDDDLYLCVIAAVSVLVHSDDDLYLCMDGMSDHKDYAGEIIQQYIL